MSSRLLRRIQTPGSRLKPQNIEESPQPSPHAPPEMTRHEQHEEQPPWTPYAPLSQTQLPDSVSVPSLPEAPSPYSPPPASLFSGEEYPPKTVRKPMSEVRLRPSESSRSRALNDLSLNQAPHAPPHPQQQQPTRLYNSAEKSSSATIETMDRSQLLPSIVLLKNDLQDAHSNFALLEQENKALAQECDRVQREMEKWQTTAKQIAEREDSLQKKVSDLEQYTTNLEEQNQTMQERVDSLKKELDQTHVVLDASQQEAQQLSSDLRASKTNVTLLETEKTKLESTVTDLEKEVREARLSLKKQGLNSAQKHKQTSDEYESKIASLESTVRSKELEMDRLQAMMRESDKQSETKRLEKELDAANNLIEQLKDEKIILESEANENEHHWRSEIQSLKNDLKSKARSSLDNIKDMQEALADATEREDALLHDKEHLENEYQSQVDDLHGHVQDLQLQVDNAQESRNELQKALSKKNDALKESYARYSALRAEKEKLLKQVHRHTRQSASPQSTGTSLQDEVQQLKADLKEANAKCKELRAERAALSRELSKKAADDWTVQQSVLLDEDDIPDRLGRIRDAAERAAIFKEYRREIAKLKVEHDAEIKRITSRHDQDLKDVFEEAKAEVSAKARESRRKLRSDYETKIATLERRYQTETSRSQRENDKNIAMLEEALQAANAEVESVTEQLDEQITVKEQLESNIREVERKLVIEQQKSKLTAQNLKDRKKWQEETNAILQNIQSECNTIFHQNMVGQPRRRTRVSEDDSTLDEGNTLVPDTPWKSSFDMDVSQALDETEAMVRSIVGK